MHGTKKNLVAAALTILMLAPLQPFHRHSNAFEEPLSPKSIRRQDGFHVELLRAAKPGEDSWISMTFDDGGNVILGLDKLGVARLKIGEKGEKDFERIDSKLKHCRGVLFAHQSLYVNSTDSKVLMRFIDEDQDGKFEKTERLIAFDYRSRYGHGANQMRLGPDKKIYVVVGNDCSVPDDVIPSSAYRNPREDWLLPEKRDLGQDRRVGYILRMNPDGSEKEIVAGGFRNPVDMDFNQQGEMFTFDADMEWDIGTPWYRPIRVNHIVSGGEYGWRWGTGKWPDYYPDSLPTNLDVGMGSPTGVTFGMRSRFPRKYRKALFIADWQNGKILVAYPRPKGASFEFELESFLDGAPLNVCDMEFGPDGKLYFITGGRGSQSALYRVSWNGKRTPEAHDTTPQTPDQHQTIRRSLEAIHGKIQRHRMEEIWKHLGHQDRWIQNAARVALESQPTQFWEKRVFEENGIDKAIAGMLALARTTPKPKTDLSGRVAARFLELARKSNQLNSSQKLNSIRMLGVLFARHGSPGNESCLNLLDFFCPLLPSDNEAIDCELLEMIVYLRLNETSRNHEAGQKAVNRAFEILTDNSRSQEAQIHMARSLAHLPHPWPVEQARSYVSWLAKTNGFRGGHLLPKTLTQMRSDFSAAITKSDYAKGVKEQLRTSLEQQASQTTQSQPLTQRTLVKEWTPAELSKLRWEAGNISKGRKIFIQAQCASCHRKGSLGSMIGPDLTQVARRYNKTALLESILEPSKQIDPKYALSTYATVDGKVYTGRVHGVNAKTLTLETDPILQTTVTIQRDDIEETKPSPTSPMPTGLLNYFSKKDIVDLFAFLNDLGKDNNQ